MKHRYMAEELLHTRSPSPRGHFLAYVVTKIYTAMQGYLKARMLPSDCHSHKYGDILSVMISACAASVGNLLRDFSRLEAKDHPTLRDFQNYVFVILLCG